MYRGSRIAAAIALLVGVLGCGGDDSSDAPAVADEPGATGSDDVGDAEDGDDGEEADEAIGTADDVDREDFVLCEAIEPAADELAGMVGFVPDPEREVQSPIPSECIVHADDGIGFVRVTLLPAAISSIELHTGGFDQGSVGPAPELGDEAVYVDQPLQPHVVFAIDGLFIDVDAETLEDAPTRETMIAVATRVEDLLVEANG